jgi:hypothetical protein
MSRRYSPTPIENASDAPAVDAQVDRQAPQKYRRQTV